MTACEAGCTWLTSPSHGASRRSLKGSIETPSPTIFWAKTGSGTCSIGTRTPVNGAFRSRRVTGGAEASVDMAVPPLGHRRSGSLVGAGRRRVAHLAAVVALVVLSPSPFLAGFGRDLGHGPPIKGGVAKMVIEDPICAGLHPATK